MELQSWLQRFGWDTANQVTRLEWTRDRRLRVELDAYPFWLAEPALPDRRRLTLQLFNIVESCVDLAWYEPLDEAAVEDLRVSVDHALLWHYGKYATVHIKAPLPDPESFLAGYVTECSALCRERDCLQYLNAEQGLKQWVDMASQSSCVLLSAPVTIAEAVQELLARQRVPLSVFPGHGIRHDWARLAVWIDDSWIVCERADVDAEGIGDSREPTTNRGRDA